MLRVRVVLATLFASTLSSVVARADDVRSDTARFGGYFQGGVEIGFAPGQTSVLPGLFLRGGPTYGVLHGGAEVSLAIGPSNGRGFAVNAGALGTLGVHAPALGTITPFADVHFGPMFFHREGPGTTDAGGLWGGVSVGVAAYDRVGSSAGGFIGATALTPLSRPSMNSGDVASVVVPLFLRAGVAIR